MILLTLIGPDGTGIIAAVTGQIAAAARNIEQILGLSEREMAEIAG
jgi:predicted amino acid-binding ACT domain protein